jgi:hypothetical protein
MHIRHLYTVVESHIEALPTVHGARRKGMDKVNKFLLQLERKTFQPTEEDLRVSKAAFVAEHVSKGCTCSNGGITSGIEVGEKVYHRIVESHTSLGRRNGNGRREKGFRDRADQELGITIHQ